jgi:O-antigen/teichoic acid export membrane protein
VAGQDRPGDRPGIEVGPDPGAVGAGGDDPVDRGEVTSRSGGNDGQSLGTTASRGFLWANVGIFTRYVLAIVLAAVLARILPPADYAVMVTLLLLVFYFDNALDLGMGAALVYEQESGVSERVQVAFSANVVLGAVLGVVALLVAPVVGWYFQAESYIGVFRLFAVVVVLSALNTVPWSLFMRDMDFRRRSVVEVTRDVTRTGLTIALAVAGYGAWSVVIGFIASNAITLVLTWWLLRFWPTLQWNWRIIRELFDYAWKVAGNRVLSVLALNGDYFIVGNRNNAQYATYYQAFKLPEFVMGAQLNALSAVLFPMFARIRSEGPGALREGMFKALRLVAIFSFPVGVGLALVARDAFTLLFGNPDPVGIQTMEVLSLTGAVVGLGFANGDLLMAINRPGVLLRINSVMVPLMLVIMWFVAPAGVVWVAVVHLGIQTVFLTIRQVIVDGLIGARHLDALKCLGPGLVVVCCVSALGLPARILTPGGWWSMLVIVVAGAAGGLVSLAVPAVRSEITEVVARVRG